jgi:hypothetical protein
MYYHYTKIKNLPIFKRSAFKIMTQKKQQLSCKSVVLLGSFLGAAIVSNASTFAAQASPVSIQTLDSKTAELNVKPVQQTAQLEQPTPTEAKPANELSPQVAPESVDKSNEKPGATEAKPVTEPNLQVAPESKEKSGTISQLQLIALPKLP